MGNQPDFDARVRAAARTALLAAMHWHGRSMCLQCSGAIFDCPGCSMPTIAPANGARYCHRCGARLSSVYGEAASAGETDSHLDPWNDPNNPKLGAASSGRSPTSPQARQELLDRNMPLHERLQAGERGLALREADFDQAGQRLRDALADLPRELRVGGRTLGEAVSILRRDVSGRALAPEAVAAVQAVLDAAAAWRRAEDILKEGRTRQAGLLEVDAERRRVQALNTDWDRIENRVGPGPAATDPWERWLQIKAEREGR